MKFNSQVIASGSGSIGGCTYSRNRYGQYIRRRAMPVNPGSVFAVAMTTFFTQLVTQWTTILSAAQRAAWDTWALNTPQTDALGNSITWTGQNAYISMNTFRLQGGMTRVDAAPIIYAGTVLSPVNALSASFATQQVSVTFTNSDQWAGAVGGILSVYTARPQNASRTFFKGPYRLASVIPGAVMPPVSPQLVPVAFPIAVGQRLFVRFRAASADARLSSMQRDNVIVGA